MMESRLTIVAGGTSAEALPAYPLPAGAMLSGLAFFPLHVARFVGSRMYATATNEEIGAALSVWAYALGSQSPGGTLPLDDAELAHAARCWNDMAAWHRVRAAVLRGWSHVRVEAEDGSARGVRLAHPMVTEVAVEMWGLVEKAQDKRSAGLARQRFYRLRAALKALGYSRQAADPAMVQAVLDWLDERGLTNSRAHVRAAAMAVSSMNST